MLSFFGSKRFQHRKQRFGFGFLLASSFVAITLLGGTGASASLLCLLLSSAACILGPPPRTQIVKAVILLIAIYTAATITFALVGSLTGAQGPLLEAILDRTSQALKRDDIVIPGRLGHAVFDVLLLKMCAVSVTLIAAILHGQSATRGLKALYVLVGVGSVLTLVTLIVHFQSTGTVLWFAKTAYVRDYTGFFFHRGANGVLCGLFAVVAALLLMTEWRDTAREFDARRFTAIDRMLRILSDRAATVVLLSTSTVMFSVGALLSNARLAAIVLVAGFISLTVLLLVGHAGTMKRRLLAASVALAALTGGTVALFSLAGAPLSRRLANETGEGSPRLDIWRFTVEAIADHPFAGHGAGTVPTRFALEQPLSLAGIGDVRSVHSLPLEMAFEFGVPWASVGIGIWLGLVWLLLAALRRSRAMDPLVAAAVLTAAILTIATSVDVVSGALGLVVPALTIIGIGVGRATTLSYGGRPPR